MLVKTIYIIKVILDFQKSYLLYSDTAVGRDKKRNLNSYNHIYTAKEGSFACYAVLIQVDIW